MRTSGDGLASASELGTAIDVAVSALALESSFPAGEATARAARA